MRPAPHRIRATPPPRPHYTEPTPPSAQQIASVVTRMRAGDETAGGQEASEIVTVLRQAARERSGVWIGYSDAEGRMSTRIVEPVVVSGGTMVAFDRLRQAPRTFSIHRISAARAQEPDPPADG
jgi:predicted DNA-binding transcriptional regulator YafY